DPKTAICVHRGDHVLEERDLAVRLWRQVLDTAERVATSLEALVAPVLRRERRVGDNDVERTQLVALDEGWRRQSVAELDLGGVAGAVEEHVHPGDCPRLRVQLLAIQEQ